ncbi:hypothetical protein QTP88_015798 [Uroleucon formosanum]
MENTGNDVSFTLKNLLDKHKCNEIIDDSDNTLGFGYNDCPDRNDPYSYTSSPEISISNDIDLNSFDIEIMAVVFDDNYVVYPHTSTPNANTNYSTTLNNNSDNFYFDINSVCPNNEQNSAISNPEPAISIKKRKMPVSIKKQIPNKNTRLSDSTLFLGLWNFNKNMLPHSYSGVNNDLINDVPSENLELYIFKHIFDEDLVQHIVEETNKFYHFLVTNTVLSKHFKLVTSLIKKYVFTKVSLNGKADFNLNKTFHLHGIALELSYSFYAILSGSVISTLMEPYVNKGHIIYMDNWYSSPTLFEYLLKKDTGACGTLPEFRLKLIEQILHVHILSDDIISPNRAGRKPKDDLPLRLNARHFPSRINSGESLINHTKTNQKPKMRAEKVSMNIVIVGQIQSSKAIKTVTEAIKTVTKAIPAISKFMSVIEDHWKTDESALQPATQPIRPHSEGHGPMWSSNHIGDHCSQNRRGGSGNRRLLSPKHRKERYSPNRCGEPVNAGCRHYSYGLRARAMAVHLES